LPTAPTTTIPSPNSPCHAEKFSALTALTDAFCERHLGDECRALIHRVIEVRAMDLTQKVQLADELYRAQPHVLASFRVQNKPGVRPTIHIKSKTLVEEMKNYVRRGPTPPGPAPVPKPRAFHGNVAINAATAKMRLVQVAEEIIAVLAADPIADVTVTLEIQAGFPSGASDQTKRAVMENARTLNFKNADWE
jgi:hypothetical protein